MENETNNISISGTNALVEKLKGCREKKDQAKIILSQIQSEEDALEAEILEILQTTGLKNFGASCGVIVGIRNDFFVRQPDGPENEDQFNNWLGEQGLDRLRKVNYQSLNSLYRERLDAAAAQGEVVVIPGLESPTVRTTLTVRKGK